MDLDKHNQVRKQKGATQFKQTEITAGIVLESLLAVTQAETTAT
jgi:hypothetical protein